MIEILSVILAFVFGAMIGWLARDFFDARRKRKELRAWVRGRKFLSHNVIKK